jgi:hypothetical protein
MSCRDMVKQMYVIPVSLRKVDNVHLQKYGTCSHMTRRTVIKHSINHQGRIVLRRVSGSHATVLS